MNLPELTRLYDFSGQTVVITGGTGVLGGEIACALVGCGANVAMLDRNLDPTQHILELMEPRANHAVAVHADVLDQESLREALENHSGEVWRDPLPGKRCRGQQASGDHQSGPSSICPPMPCDGCLT
jgi:hypothetical protein